MPAPASAQPATRTAGDQCHQRGRAGDHEGGEQQRAPDQRDARVAEAIAEPALDVGRRGPQERGRGQPEPRPGRREAVVGRSADTARRSRHRTTRRRSCPRMRITLGRPRAARRVRARQQRTHGEGDHDHGCRDGDAVTTSPASPARLSAERADGQRRARRPGVRPAPPPEGCVGVQREAVQAQRDHREGDRREHRDAEEHPAPMQVLGHRAREERSDQRGHDPRRRERREHPTVQSAAGTPAPRRRTARRSVRRSPGPGRAARRRAWASSSPRPDDHESDRRRARPPRTVGRGDRSDRSTRRPRPFRSRSWPASRRRRPRRARRRRGRRSRSA